MEDKSKHSGHRQRIKNRVKKYGLKSLEPHEIMEVMLTYSIPRKDTNALAHLLLENFGSIAKVVDAEASQLKLFKGIGDETITFFKILKEFVDVYLESKKDTKQVKLDTTIKCVNYFKEHFQFKNTECLYGFCLTKTGVFCHHFVIESAEYDEIEFTIKSLADNISSDKIKKVVIIHTHPKGDTQPSKADIVATDVINSVCVVMGAELVDHIIMNENSFFSFKSGGCLKEKSLDAANEAIKNLNIILKNRK